MGGRLCCERRRNPLSAAAEAPPAAFALHGSAGLDAASPAALGRQPGDPALSAPATPKRASRRKRDRQWCSEHDISPIYIKHREGARAIEWPDWRLAE